MAGEGGNITLALGVIGITYCPGINPGEWGLSFSALGRGLGFGLYVNQSWTYLQ